MDDHKSGKAGMGGRVAATTIPNRERKRQAKSRSETKERKKPDGLDC